MKRFRYMGLGLCIAALIVGLQAGRGAIASQTAKPTQPPAEASLLAQTADPVQQMQQGKTAYQSGQYGAAVIAWQAAAQSFASRGDRLNQAAVLSNLALAYQQLGQWPEANQAIATSLELVQGGAGGSDRQTLLAQVLNIQGSLQMGQGQSQQALDTWQAATRAYQAAGDRDGATRSLINQTQAYRALGLYPRAKAKLAEVNQTLQGQADSALKVAGLLNYGDALRLVGDFDQSTRVLQQGLAIAERLASPPDVTLALLSLGNVARAQQDLPQAAQYYQKAIASTAQPDLRVQAQLNQLRLLTDVGEWNNAANLLPTLWPQVETLPASRTNIYARVNLAQSAMQLRQQNTKTTLAGAPLSNAQIAQILATAIQQAKQLGDQRAESYATGYLGTLYETTQQRTNAQTLTNQALLLAQVSNAPDISYRWQWQLGRILKAQGNAPEAIAAYSQSVKTLDSIRRDLVASSPDIQFSFKESVEPVYREFVALLLEPTQPGSDASQENLKKAREVIESLQLAELDNFFREACLTGQSELVDQVDSRSAVVYPIILPDRLEVVLSIPGQPLRHYATPIAQADLEQTVEQMRRSLRRTSSQRERLETAQKVYNLLLRPAEADLAQSDVTTLAFVLDGPMRNVPMAALHDGRQFLLEKYSIALTPGLQLLDPRPLKSQQLTVLIGALSQGRQGFSALPGVETEVKEITTEVPTQVLFNETFTTASFQQQVSNVPFRVVHLATHGQFSSNADDTFILTWDRRIDVKQLGELLQIRDQDTQTPVELLVLSACQTAEGDRRAALGLAGVAVRSGARSTLATLWAVDDQSTSALMVQFYQELAKAGTTKAEALRQSQLALLKQPQFQHPYYWAPFVLIGNWL